MIVPNQTAQDEGIQVVLTTAFHLNKAANASATA